MLQALDLTKTTIFESDRDPAKGTDKATQFKICAIPSRVYAQLKDKATTYSQSADRPDDVKADFRPNHIAKDMVRFGLRGIENYSKPDGSLVEFKTQKERVGNQQYDVVHDDVIDCMDLETIREVGLAIRGLCEVDEDTVKNSEG